VVEKFVQAARRAYEAGFDGVQLHAAHGYLLSAFLSPRMNRREDRYGGCEGGVRVLKEIIEGIKALAGDGFLVAVKLGVDGGKRGNGPQEVVEVLRGLAASGLHCAEISRGVAPVEEIIREGVKPGEGEAYNLEVALYVKEHLPSLPLILVGGLRSARAAQAVGRRGSFTGPLPFLQQVLHRERGGGLQARPPLRGRKKTTVKVSTKPISSCWRSSLKASLLSFNRGKRSR